MDRRKFLVSAGLGAGLLATASPVSLSLPGMATKKNAGKSGKIKLSCEPYELKRRHAFNLAKMSRTTTPDVQVKLEYEGLVGYGEASMPPYLGESVDSVCKFLNQVDMSQFNDPFRMDEILDYVGEIAPNNRAAKASIDIALHDLVGKMLGQPWYKIWGLNPDKTPNTTYTISYQSDPEEMQHEFDETADFKVIKIKMGVGHDKELVERFRQITDKPFCVDANQGWKTKEEALAMCEWLADKNCQFVEQPMEKEKPLEDVAWLRERSPLPILADEAFQRLPDILKFHGVYDGINIKLMKSTGLREARQMVVLARALGMKVMVGCMTETSCAVSAAAQLSPQVDWCDLDGNLLISNDRFEGMKVVDGKVTLPDRPGIGVKLL